MAECEFIAYGDNHIEKIMGLFPEKGLDYAFQALNYANGYAREHGIKHMVKLGDIYDSPFPEQKSQAMFARCAHENKDILWHGIRGNHDYEGADAHSLEVFEAYSDIGALPNVKFHFDPTLSDIDGVPVCYLSHPYKKVPKNAGQRIVFGHFEFAGATLDSGRILKAHEGVPQPKGVSRNDYFWIMGHLHRYHRLGRRIIYAGTSLQQNFGEPLPKGFLHVRASYRKGVLKVMPQFIPYHTPYELHNIHVHTKADLKKVKLSKRMFYKIFMHERIDLPENFFIDHPNVLKHEGTFSKAVAENDEKVSVKKGTTVIDPEHGLLPFLKAQGLTKEQRIIARKEVRAARGA